MRFHVELNSLAHGFQRASYDDSESAVAHYVAAKAETGKYTGGKMVQTFAKPDGTLNRVTTARF